MSLIDFHATDDTNVPYDLAGAEAMGGGAGPLGSLINEEGFYYEDKVGGMVWYGDTIGMVWYGVKLPDCSPPKHRY